MRLIDKLKSSAKIGMTILALNPIIAKAMQGSGTQESPYQITTTQDLNEINKENKYTPSSHYVLKNNINTKSQPFQPIGHINSKIIPFTGSFDGDNNSIDNLYINQPNSDYIGLFAINSGEIQNLSLNNINLIGNNYVGALAGENNGIIINCNSNGEIEGFNMLGGLVGFNTNKISHSYSKTNINGKNGEIRNIIIGGLVGRNWKNANISNCYATGNTTGDTYIGGFVGYNDGKISNSYSTGKVQGNTLGEGGFCGGDSAGTYTNCFYETQTPEQNTSNGGTGLTTTQMKNPSSFKDWDFSENPQDPTQPFWKIIPNQTYPFLNQNNQFLNQAPIFYGIFAGINESDEDGKIIHRFGDDAQALYNALITYPGIKQSNLIPISALNLEQTIKNTIDKINPNDTLFIYYSGHGSYNNNDSEPKIENSDKVAKKTKQEFNTGDEFFIYGNKENRKYLIDDKLTDLLSNEKLDNVSKMVILDCCMSGGFWGRQGNESDIGDLDKLTNIGFISACEENEFSYSYSKNSLNPNKAGRGIFSYHLINQLKRGTNGISPADINKDGAVSFNELRESIKNGYSMSKGDIGVIRTISEDPNDIPFNWFDTDPNEISDPNFILSDPNQLPQSVLGFTSDFNSNNSINTHMPGDLTGDLFNDFNDFAKFSSQWLRQDCSGDKENNWCEGADINKDGKVDNLDLMIFSGNYLDTRYYDEE